MHTVPITGSSRFITTLTSRRDMLAATAGLLAAREFTHGWTTSEAKKTGKRKKKHKKTRKKDSIEVRVDAICPGPTDNAGFVLNEGSLHAQTFTALNTGRLVLAEVLISASGNGSAELTLQLRDIDASGAPTTEVLAEASLNVSNVPAGESTIFFTFADPPSVVAHQPYALVLSQTGSRSVSWKGHFGNTCTGGVFRSEPSTEPFEQVLPDELDLIFTTIVSS